MKLLELFEAFNVTRKEKGEVPFKKSALSDPHVQAVINEISKRTGVPVNLIVGEIQDVMDEYSEIGKYSPLLYDTLIQNAAENAAFNNLSKSVKSKKLDISDVKFDWRIFERLVEHVEDDHWGGLLPLKKPGPKELSEIKDIKVIYVPSKNKDEKKYNHIDTAAATPDGVFIFNVPFMQELIYYATITGEKPTSAKYVSNGGDIPDNYCYIEFLIVHELLHYAYGDADTGRRYKQYSHTAHNFAMDFRSNYLMMKSGYTQLPLGLFSDDLNFDRIQRYEDLIRIVDEEMKKLPESLRAFVEDLDDHPTNPGPDGKVEDEESEPPPPWEPKPGEIVLNQDTGEFGVVEVSEGGKVTIKSIPREMVEDIYPGINIG